MSNEKIEVFNKESSKIYETEKIIISDDQRENFHTIIDPYRIIGEMFYNEHVIDLKDLNFGKYIATVLVNEKNIKSYLVDINKRTKNKLTYK